MRAAKIGLVSLGDNEKYFVGNLFVITWDACDLWRPMNFREKLRMVELSEYLNVINIFDDINSALHTVTTIHHKVSVLVKVMNVLIV